MHPGQRLPILNALGIIMLIFRHAVFLLSIGPFPSSDCGSALAAPFHGDVLLSASMPDAEFLSAATGIHPSDIRRMSVRSKRRMLTITDQQPLPPALLGELASSQVH